MLSHRFSPQFLGSAADQAKLGSDELTGDAVFCQASIVLEVQQASLCDGTEYSVDLVGIEPEGIEPRLQLGYVVSAHHGNAVVEQTLAESVPGVDEGPPGVWTDDPVYRKAAAALEIRNGLVGGFAEDAGFIGFRGVSKCVEPRLDIPNRLATITLVK